MRKNLSLQKIRLTADLPPGYTPIWVGITAWAVIIIVVVIVIIVVIITCTGGPGIPRMPNMPRICASGRTCNYWFSVIENYFFRSWRFVRSLHAVLSFLINRISSQSLWYFILVVRKRLKHTTFHHQHGTSFSHFRIPVISAKVYYHATNINFWM